VRSFIVYGDLSRSMRHNFTVARGVDLSRIPSIPSVRRGGEAGDAFRVTSLHLSVLGSAVHSAFKSRKIPGFATLRAGIGPRRPWARPFLESTTAPVWVQSSRGNSPSLPQAIVGEFLSHMEHLEQSEPLLVSALHSEILMAPWQAHRNQGRDSACAGAY
jgi:hypothetical protein